MLSSTTLKAYDHFFAQKCGRVEAETCHTFVRQRFNVWQIKFQTLSFHQVAKKVVESFVSFSDRRERGRGEGEGEGRGWGKLSSIFDNFSSLSFLSATVPLRLGISATELSHEGQ